MAKILQLQESTLGFIPQGSGACPFASVFGPIGTLSGTNSLPPLVSASLLQQQETSFFSEPSQHRRLANTELK